MVLIGEVEIPFDSNKPFNGAFKYIQNVTQQNDIVFYNYIRVSVPSAINQYISDPITNITATTHAWESQPKEGSWYEIDFLENCFHLEKYVLRAHSHDFFEEWNMLGSNDGVHYDTVDHVSGFKEPSGNTFVNQFFECSNPLTKRIFRYVPKGPRFYQHNEYASVIHKLEFYGKFTKYCVNNLKCTQTNIEFIEITVFVLIYILVF